MKRLIVLLSFLALIGCATAQVKPTDPETAKQEEMQEQVSWGTFSDVIFIIWSIAIH